MKLTDSRDELTNAQFMLGEDYVDWVWRERGRAAPVVPRASISWPFKRADNVVAISSRKKK